MKKSEEKKKLVEELIDCYQRLDIRRLYVYPRQKDVQDYLANVASIFKNLDESDYQEFVRLSKMINPNIEREERKKSVNDLSIFMNRKVAEWKRYNFEDLDENSKNSTENKISLVNIGRDYIVGDKVGRDKNKNPPTSNWLSKYWWKLAIPIFVIIISYIVTEGKMPLLFSANLNETKINISVPSIKDKIDTKSLKKANCWTSSLSTGRSDAYRCGVDNYVYDPCFLNPFYSSVQVIGCPLNEKEFKYFQADGLKISNEPYPDCSPPECGRPWLVELLDGTKCRAITGTLNVVAGNFTDYSCEGNGGFDFLSQPFIKDENLYKVNCSNKNTISTCIIKTMWY